MTMLKDIGGLLALTARLLARFWPQLLLIGTLGYIARDLLLDAAVSAGGYFPLAGMVVLSLVVLVKLLVVVTMFATLRPGLPALASLRQTATVGDTASSPDNRRADRMLMVTAAVILPFFAYYAAWGFLGDTVREYSRLAFERTAFGEKMHIFDLVRSGSLIAAIFVCWLIRWIAKRANEKFNRHGCDCSLSLRMQAGYSSVCLHSTSGKTISFIGSGPGLCSTVSMSVRHGFR